jgi:hypothetical protein
MSISDEFARDLLDLLSEETIFSRDLFHHEIQDAGLSVFISVQVDHFSDSQVMSAVRRMAELLHQRMPVRNDDHTWVVGLMRNSEVVESCFGGNLAIPDWNGEQFVE